MRLVPLFQKRIRVPPFLDELESLSPVMGHLLFEAVERGPGLLRVLEPFRDALQPAEEPLDTGSQRLQRRAGADRVGRQSSRSPGPTSVPIAVWSSS